MFQLLLLERSAYISIKESKVTQFLAILFVELEGLHGESSQKS